MKKYSILFLMFCFSKIFTLNASVYSEQDSVSNIKKIDFLIELPVLAGASFIGPRYHSGSMDITSFCHMKNSLSLGAGAGIMVFLKPQITGHSDRLYGYPFYAYGRWDFKRRKRVVPFIALKVGYMIMNGEYESPYVETIRKYSGGFYSSLSGGTVFYLKDRKGISLAFATNFQNSGCKDFSEGKVVAKERFNTLNYSLNLGFLF